MAKSTWRVRFVYVIGPEDGPFKIGVSRTPQRRLSEFQTGHPLPLKLYFASRFVNAVEMERQLHRRFKDRRVAGEWFAVPLEEIIEAMDPSDNRPKATSDNPFARRLDNGGLSADLSAEEDGPQLASNPLALKQEFARALGEPDEELRDDFRGAYALNTLRAYRADWADWVAWCGRHHKAPLPAEPRALRDYLVDLAAVKKLATLRRRLAAISKAHRLAGIELDKLDPTIYHALRRIARTKGFATAGRAELMTDDILAMLRQVPDGLRGVRDRAMLLLAFASGVRRSELVALDVNHVNFRRDGIVITLPRSKTDQEGRGQQVGVVYGQRQSSCPVRALKRWLEGAGIREGRIFRQISRDRADGAPLSDRAFYEMVKRYATAAGLDPAKLGAHSLRVGHVTQARANGADLGDTQRQLRHKKIETTQGYDRGRALRSSSSAKLGL